jgi:glutamyl-tRNA reductase
LFVRYLSIYITIAVFQRNTAKRRREMLEAELILKEELGKFRLWQQSLGAIPTIAKLQEKAETLRQEEMTKAAKVIIMNYFGYYDITDNKDNHDDN